MNASAQAIARSAGLFVSGTSSAPVPLEGVKVHADLLGHASRVTVSQRFRNVEQVPIEAVYVFPLPEAAAVCGLTMRVGDRVIEGEIEPRDKAFEHYDDAMAAGHGAALLDMERPNVFTVSVGNVLPGQEVVIEVKWVAELPVEGEAIRFVLPTTVAPRYAPAEDLQGISPTPAERVSPPIALDVPYGLALDVDVTLPCQVRSIDSPSHPVRFEIDGRRARITLSHETAAMDRDFVLLVTPVEAGRPHVLVERNEDGTVTAAVSIVPRLPASDARNEVIFLVDRSGSMDGSSIEQVRAALQLCLRSLHDGDRFNIVGFGSSVGSLFPESVAYDDETLKKASDHVDGLRADLGGTEILPALAAVLQREPCAGLRRQVVLLTDGEVSNEAAVIELAQQHHSTTRIFTFGIGYGASEHLVRSLARVTRGQAEFIHPGERIEPKVLRQFARIGTPAVREVKVEWQGAVVALGAPYRPGAVFNGGAAVVYARLDGAAGDATPTGRGTGAPSPVTMMLMGDAEGTPVRWGVPVDVEAAGPGSLLATLAARAAIRDLEEGTSALHEQQRGSAQRGRRDERVNQAIVALGTTYHLVSSQTSFVAVERREAAEDQPAAELRRVPVELTQGWGGAVDRCAAVYAQRFASVSRAFRIPGAMYDLTFNSDSHIRACRSIPQPAPPAPDQRDVDAMERLAARAPERARPEPPHVALARLQRADGSWRLDANLARALGVTVAALRATATSLEGSGTGVPPVSSGADTSSIVATVAALRFLTFRAPDARDEWLLLAEKGARWLDAAFDAHPDLARADVERVVAALL